MPPTVKRQNPTGDKVSKGGLRDRMIPVGDIRKGMRVCIYGIPKSGKTRIACTFPGKKLILGFEDGTSSVSTSMDTIWLPITSSDEFKEGLVIAVEDKFDSVILDEASGFRMVLLKEQLGLLNVPVQLTWAMAKKQDWGAVAGNFKENVNDFFKLASTHGKNMIVLSHENNLTSEEEMIQGIPGMMGPSLGKASALWLNGAVDYLCQTYIREKMEYKEQVINGVKKTTSKSTGKSEYMLRIVSHEKSMVGFRMPLGSKEPEEDIANPTYEKIRAVIEGES
jgi:hypothetical protein